MSITHKDYPGLVIYRGEHGETPKPGAFYIPRPGDTLTKIALAAYGSKNQPLINASIINRSPYNMALAKVGIVRYRTDASRCNSPTIKKAYPEEYQKFGLNFVHTYKNGNTRPMGQDKAWLGMCPTKLNIHGSYFPMIWIPTLSGAEPGDIVHGGDREDLPPLVKVLTPAVSVLRPGKNQLPPQPSVNIPGIGGGGTDGGGSDGGARPPAMMQRAGVPTWFGWLALAGLGGGLYYWYRTAKS